jgi:hypothetical protein
MLNCNSKIKRISNKMPQFKAGYILDVIANQISSFEQKKADKYNVDVLKNSGAFNVYLIF